MPPPTEIPTHVPVGVITAFSGLAERTVRQWAVEGKVPKSEPGLGYPFLATVTAIREQVIANLKPTDVQADKAATIKADREIAEIRAAEARGELMHLPVARAAWLDMMVRIRDWVMRTKLIPAEQRTKAISELKALEVGELKIE